MLNTICDCDKGRRVGYIELARTVEITKNGEYNVKPETGYQEMEGVEIKSNVSYWKVSGNPKFAFNGNVAEIILDGWDTEGQTDMTSMFNSCYRLISLDLSNFSTPNVKTMDYMFNMCSDLVSLDISNFDLSNVKNTSQMFAYCQSLEVVKVTNCPEATQQKILTQLKTDLSKYTWTLSDGIITRS